MNTVNKKEIEKFSKMAEEWWDVEGKFKPLHKFNPIRIKYIKESVIENFDHAEYDTLLSTGEQVACALIAGNLKSLGYNSRSWLSWQLPILTEGNHSNSRISNINTKNIKKYMKEGGIPIVTGFQGINSKLRVTTIGRSGSDASEKNIEIAKIHAKKNNLNINYICASPEKIQNKKFDVILNMEIVEHVENVDLFLKSSSDLLKKKRSYVCSYYQ